MDKPTGPAKRVELQIRTLTFHNETSFFCHLHVYFWAKVHFQLVESHRPPGLVYNLRGVHESIPKNSYTLDAKFYDPVFLPLLPEEGSTALIRFPRGGCTSKQSKRPSILAYPFSLPDPTFLDTRTKTKLGRKEKINSL